METKILIGLLIIGIFISGCAEKECKIASDCLAKTCFTAECKNNNCTYSIVSNCCGNDKCESTESYETCAADCPNCDDRNDCTADSYDFHEQKCINELIVPCCGNDICDKDVEAYSNCPADCPNCDDNNDCTADSYDYHGQKCLNAPIPNVICCGNSVCEIGETYETCTKDCPNCDDENECTEDSYEYHEEKCIHEPIIPCCGNGICDEETAETYLSCETDCPNCDDDNKLTGDNFNYTTQKCEYVTYCFFEDFNEGSASWDLGPGWSIVNGMLASEGTTHTKFGDESWTDYTLSFKVEPGLGMHIHIRHSSEGSYDLVISDYRDDFKEGQLYLRKDWEGEASLEMKEYPFEPDQFYDIKIELKGSNIKVYIDDNLEIDVTDTENPLLAGNIRLASFWTLYLDDIKVEGPCSE